MTEKFSWDWADVELLKSKNSVVDDVFIQDGEYYVLRREVIRGPGGWYYFLEKYDRSLNRIKVHDVSAIINEERFITHGFVKMGDMYVIVSSDFESNTETYYIQYLNTHDLSVTARKKVVEFNDVKKRGWYNPIFSVSENGMFALFRFVRRDKKAKTEAMNCFVFDHNLDLYWKKENLDITGKYFREIFIDNDGAVHLAMSDRKKFLTPQDRRSIDFINLNEDMMKETTFEFQNYVPEDVMVSQADGGAYYLAGYYRNDENDVLEGVFCITFNPITGEVIKEVQEEFPDELLKEGESARTQKKIDKKTGKGKDLGANSLEMTEVIAHQDGSISVVGERQWVTTHVTTDANGNIQTRYVYHYSDMYIARIGDGKVQHMHKINRYGSSSAPFTAHRAFGLNNNLYVIFYDHRENLIAIDPKAGTKSSNTKQKYRALSVVEIDGSNKTREGVLDYANKDIEPYRAYWLDRDVFMLENGEILFWTYKGKKKFSIGMMRPKM